MINDRFSQKTLEHLHLVYDVDIDNDDSLTVVVVIAVVLVIAVVGVDVLDTKYFDKLDLTSSSQVQQENKPMNQ